MSAAGKSNPLAISGLVVLTLIWSYSWIFMKQVTSYIGAFDFTALRCIFGALVLFIVLLLRGRGMRPTPFKYTLAIALLQTCRFAVWHRLRWQGWYWPGFVPRLVERREILRSGW